MSELELRKLLEYDEADLAANQKGMLSERQKNDIKKGDVKFYRQLAVFAIIILIVGIVVSYTILQANPFPRIFPDEVRSLMVAWGVAGVILAGMAYLAFGLKVDWSVFGVEGSVRFSMTERDQLHEHADGQQYYEKEKEYDLHVGEQVFEGVQEELRNLIGEGDIYKFYYLKNADGRIVSAEFIAKGK